MSVAVWPQELDEPAAAGGAERVIMLTETPWQTPRSVAPAPAKTLIVAAGPTFKTRLSGGPGCDEQRCQPACSSGADHVVL